MQEVREERERRERERERERERKRGRERERERCQVQASSGNHIKHSHPCRVQEQATLDYEDDELSLNVRIYNFFLLVVWWLAVVVAVVGVGVWMLLVMFRVWAESG